MAQRQASGNPQPMPLRECKLNLNSEFEPGEYVIGFDIPALPVMD
jgi:hypothetical protein